MNDLDLSVRTREGTRYPNGRSSIDTKNTVERVKMEAMISGEEVRVFGKSGRTAPRLNPE